MTMKVLFFAAMSLSAFAPGFAQSTDIETQARPPAVQTAPVPAEVPGGCNTPAGERTSEVGCYLDATELLGELPQGPLFWHLYNYPTRAAAEAAKGSRGTVVESFDRVWLYTIAEAGWHPSSGARVAVIGPLRTVAGKQYTARYMEAVFRPGMQARTHQHSGPEAWYLVSGSQCLETPEGITVAHAGDSAVVREGPPMTLSSVGAETRRSVLLVLHDSSQPWMTLTSEWTPKGLCPK
jgi:quercetin dioxygenase-like cupin family protein